MKRDSHQYTSKMVLEKSVIVLEFGDGKLNPLGLPTRREILENVLRAQDDESVSAIVLLGRGNKAFSAGADIREFGQMDKNFEINNKNNISKDASLVQLCQIISECKKPVVAAINGACLGGGLEVALSCHFRVCSSTAKLGLPETLIGLIPGAGGTQRLPRLVGMQFAVDLILSGRQVEAFQAQKICLVDAVVKVDEISGQLIQTAKKWANWACELCPLNLDSRVLHLKSVRGSPDEHAKIINLAKSKLAPPHRGGQALHAALTAIHASSTKDFEKGMQLESSLFLDLLLNSAQSRALRHVFFSQRAVQQPFTMSCGESPDDSTRSLALSQISTVGVIGAGTMGQGIAIAFLRAGYKLVLVDVNTDGLKRGVEAIRTVLEKANTKSSSLKLLTPSQLDFSTQLSALASCQVVIEAVFEKLDIKQDLFEKLDLILIEPQALLLTNTSTLDISAIMKRVSPKRRPFVAGMHFFSPAHVMKLVECVHVPNQTSKQTIRLAQQLVKRLGKIGVVVANGPNNPSTNTEPPRVDGFVGNRMIFPYSCEAILLLMEPTTPQINLQPKDIDSALVDFGMAMGPFQMADLSGNDIGYLIRKAKALVDEPASPNRRYPSLADSLVVDLKRVGQKALKGWYDYDLTLGKGRKPLPSKDVAKFINDYRQRNTYTTTTNLTKPMPDEIVQRLLFPLVNEGFKILHEGVARTPADIDMIYLFGYGFPSWRGGPMFWADNEIGLPNLLLGLEKLHKQFPQSEYFVPSDLLRTCVAQGLTLTEYYQSRAKSQSKL